MEPSLALQAAIRDRLISSSALTSLIPADNILDKNALPLAMPCILLGEGQTIPDAGLARDRHKVFLDLHIWHKEPGLAQSKTVAGAIRDALSDAFWIVPGFDVADLYVTMSRFMRDPDGIHSHGVISLKAQVREL